MAYLNIPEALLSTRARRSVTQQAAADAVGVSLRTWKSWESGEAMPSASRLMALTGFIGMRLTDLVRLIQHDAKASTDADVPQAVRT